MARNPTQQTMKSLKLKCLTGFPPPLLAGSGERAKNVAKSFDAFGAMACVPD